MEKINIHFICRGNIYRSRLAEAYLKSLQNPKWNISSSGINAEKHKKSHTPPWAEMVAAQNNISQWLLGTNTSTSQSDLDDSDLIIFMSEDVYRDAQKIILSMRTRALYGTLKIKEIGQPKCCQDRSEKVRLGK